ncbi:MAG: hypothetical protein V3S68_09055 [Dehalococcoidia bacterium]
MPVYCYTTKQGFTYERVFPMGKAPKTVSTEYGTAERDIRAEHSGVKHRPGSGWPMESDALGVSPTQVAEAEAEARSLGVPTEYNKQTGCAKLRTRGHRTKLMNVLGYVDRNAGYGDACGG